MIVPTLEVCSSASLICSILIQTKLLKALLQGSWQNLSHLLSKSDFWRCALEHFNYGFFEEYSCKTITQIYLDTEYKLPFTIMDQSKVRFSGSSYTILFPAYSSLFARFLHFYASGFKRAIGIKYLANSFQATAEC